MKKLLPVLRTLVPGSRCPGTWSIQQGIPRGPEDRLHSIRQSFSFLPLCSLDSPPANYYIITTLEPMIHICSLAAAALSLSSADAFRPSSPRLGIRTVLFAEDTTIISPFDVDSDVDLPPKVQDVDQGPLPLTWENVELVLDGMRHFLIQDGGNVKITEIDGPVVRLELQVRCSVKARCVSVCACDSYLKNCILYRIFIY